MAASAVITYKHVHLFMIRILCSCAIIIIQVIEEQAERLENSQTQIKTLEVTYILHVVN